MDTVCESEKDLTIPTQILIWLHVLFCPSCAGELKKLRQAEEIMKSDFLGFSPGFEGLIMERIRMEEKMEEKDAPSGFSFRSWVITGFFVLFSLSSVFFGMDFIEIANAEGLSFLLPVGLTIGMVVTCYGALFIGSHLKELSGRFGLR
jgi:hypothetical protein